MTRKERNSFNTIPCVVCNVTIHKDDNNMWVGLVGSIEGGFSSDFDFDVFNLGICNKCVKEKADSGTIYYSHNNMEYLDSGTIYYSHNNMEYLDSGMRYNHDKIVDDIPSEWDDTLKAKIREEKINDIIDENE